MKACIVLLSVLLVLLAPVFAGAQTDFPNRPINLLVCMPAGGTADVSSRLIAKIGEKYLGQSVVIVNKLGGAGTVGTAAIAAAKPDGYTIGYLGTSPIVTVPHVAKLTYHPVKDLEPIMQYGASNFAVSVRGDSPFNSSIAPHNFPSKQSNGL